MIKLICLDLDFTLLNSHHMLNLGQIPWLRELSKSAMMVFASGRPLASILPIAKLIGDDVVDYYISNNGSYSIDKHGEIIFEKTIDSQKLIYLVNKAMKMGVHPYFYHEDDVIAFYDSVHVRHDSQVTGLNIVIEEDIERSINSKKIHKLIVMGEPKKMSDYFLSIADLEGVNPILAKPHFGEIPAEGVDKGAVLKLIMEKYDLKPEEIIAVGDSVNDVGMLELAGFGLAMDNAAYNVKKSADYILKINNDENLGEVLYQLFNSDMDENILKKFTYKWR